MGILFLNKVTDIDGNGLYLSSFYCLCFMNERTVGVQGGNSREEVDPDLEINEDVGLCYNRGSH